MLLTMADAYNDEFIAMPNPERIDKVELSMEHLEEVVRERNRAYYQLEVGVSGERERILRPDCFGRTLPYKKREHSMPFVMNTSYRRKIRFRFHNSGREDVLDFQARMREREMYAQRGRENEQMRMVGNFSPQLLAHIKHVAQNPSLKCYPTSVLGCQSFEKISTIRLNCLAGEVSFGADGQVDQVEEGGGRERNCRHRVGCLITDASYNVERPECAISCQ